METLSSDVLFELAKHLPLVSLYRLSLCSTRFSWLIGNNLLFKYLCQRDFAIQAHPFPENLQKSVVPDYSKRQKFVYKVLEYLRREISLSLKMQEQRLNVAVELIGIPDQHKGQRMLDCLSGHPLIDQEGLAYFHAWDYDPEVAQLCHINLDHKYSAMECKFLEEPYDGGPFGGYVLIVKEGLAVYCDEKSKYYLVIPESGIISLFKACGYNDIDDQDLKCDGKIREEAYKKLHPKIKNKDTIRKNVYKEANSHTKHFGFRG